MPPVRRTRVRHAKSFRGCNTCKVRRVKCDETFPECKRCTSSGRRCEGRESLQVSLFKDKRSIGFESLENSPLANAHLPFLPQWAQRRAFSYYISKTAPYFASTLDYDFYSVVLPQAAHVHPIIRNILLTISKFFELPLRHFNKGNAYTPLTTKHVQALEWYGEALAAKIGEQRGPDLIETMLSCMLFAVVELQQNNFNGGLSLIRTGYRCLSALLTMDLRDLRRLDGLRQTIILAMAPLALRSACMINTGRSLRAGHLDLTASFDEVQSAVFNLLTAVFGSLKDIWAAIVESEDSLFIPIREHQQKLHTRLHGLQDVISGMIAEVPDTRVEQLLDYLCAIESWLLVIDTVISRPTELFELTLAHAEDLFSKYQMDSHGKPHFFSHMIVLPALWFTTMLAFTEEQRYCGFRLMKHFAKCKPEGQLIAIVITEEPYGDSRLKTWMQFCHVIYEDDCKSSHEASYFKTQL